MQVELEPRGPSQTEPDTLIRLAFHMETAVFKKLIPVLGMLAFVAGPVFAADAPPASTTSAATDSGKATPKASSHHKHHHQKKAAKPS